MLRLWDRLELAIYKVSSGIGERLAPLLFSPDRDRANASFYSLIETAKANGLKPLKYLRYLFEKFPYAKTSEDVFNLLPMSIS